MEKQRKLNLADLQVESFTTAEGTAKRGTVRANESGWWDCDSFGCGSDQPETCYAGCEDTCRNTRTSEHGWVSCNHSACWEYTCADPADSCKPESYPIAC